MLRKAFVLGLVVLVALILGGCAGLVPHTVSTPDRPFTRSPTTSTTGEVGRPMFFGTGGAVCSQGHSVQYQWSWGDGTFSRWLFIAEWSNIWDTPGTYDIRVRARCLHEETVISPWSDLLTVTIQFPPPPPPVTLSGRGDTITDSFPLVRGSATFTFRHQGESNFIVRLVTIAGKRVDLLVNKIGSYSGVVLVSVGGDGLFDPDPGRHVLEIRADGPWEVTIRQGLR